MDIWHSVEKHVSAARSKNAPGAESRRAHDGYLAPCFAWRQSAANHHGCGVHQFVFNCPVPVNAVQKNGPHRFLVAGRKDHDLDGSPVAEALVRGPSNRGTRRAMVSIGLRSKKIKSSSHPLPHSFKPDSEGLVDGHVDRQPDEEGENDHERLGQLRLAIRH